jgi:CheY-like chemotaxis protein
LRHKRQTDSLDVAAEFRRSKLMNILILEDDPLVAMTLKALLAEAGQVVFGPAMNCAQALKLAEGSRPDVIFTNIHLGLGTDGVACSRSFLDLGIPAVFVTGSREEALAARDVALGYLCKPCDPERVGAAVSVVEKLLAGETPHEEVPGFMIFAEGVEIFRHRMANGACAR